MKKNFKPVVYTNAKILPNIDFLGVFNIPEYALNALINNDFSGLSEEDQKNINKFNEKYNYPWVELSKNEDPFFSFDPEFGLPCNCIECNIFITITEEED